MDSLKIRDMNKSDKPREKMMEKGVNYLSDSELLAVLIGTGSKKYSAIDLSSIILNRSENGLRGLVDLDIKELCEIKGVGVSKASIIKAALELGNRVAGFIPDNYKIKNPWDVYTFYMEDMRYLKKEVFKAILLDTKNQIIGDFLISMGSLNYSIVHPREVFLAAIRKSSNSIILMHNHPSGNPEPSIEDEKLTERMVDCGIMLGIEILDHIIIGEGKYYSFKENNKI